MKYYSVLLIVAVIIASAANCWSAAIEQDAVAGATVDNNVAITAERKNEKRSLLGFGYGGHGYGYGGHGDHYGGHYGGHYAGHYGGHYGYPGYSYSSFHAPHYGHGYYPGYGGNYGGHGGYGFW